MTFIRNGFLIGGTEFSAATPQPLGVATPGTTGTASDAGHVHPTPSASDVGAVPTARTVAGAALSADITTATIATALGLGAVTATGASKTVARTAIGIPGTTIATIATFPAPDAAGVNVHAAIPADNAAPITTVLTNPVIPRTLQYVFTAGWNGGDPTTLGTDQFGAAISETVSNVAGSTVQGSKVFATVTSISNGLVGTVTETLTVQTGPKLGLSVLPAAPGALATVDGVLTSAQLNTTYGSVNFGTAPDGLGNYVMTYAGAWV